METWRADNQSSYLKPEMYDGFFSYPVISKIGHKQLNMSYVINSQKQQSIFSSTFFNVRRFVVLHGKLPAEAVFCKVANSDHSVIAML